MIQTSRRFFLNFFKLEAASGIMLLGVTALALLAANSPVADGYRAGLELPLFGESLAHWINDGLMAIFFLLVGMEIKREIVQGELSSPKKAALPLIGALGGMALPALIYIGMNWGNAATLRGWAIPSATDIAFSLGILSLFGSRIPVALRVFLMALAVLDDLGAVIIIAFFYTEKLDMQMLGCAVLILMALYALAKAHVRVLGIYLVLGAGLWWTVLHSGVHATIAGVLLGFMIPLTTSDERGESLLHKLTHALHPWVAFGIMPIFAFANAGVSFEGLTLAALGASVPMGIALGLFLGKPFGIFGASWLAIRCNLANKPAGASWAEFWGVGMLAGIGFTMSLFIGMLALPGMMQDEVRIGVLLGSALSAVCGYVFLKRFSK